MSKVDASVCQWNEPGGLEEARKIIAFIESVGIPVRLGAQTGVAFLPGLSVAAGEIHIDPATPSWPGDLLHEAGHIAVTEPHLRGSLEAVAADGGEEMAAIAWSVAAAQACQVELEVLFHPSGYKGESDWLLQQFVSGAPFGVPLLVWYGMTGDPQRDQGQKRCYPEMERWLR